MRKVHPDKESHSCPAVKSGEKRYDLLNPTVGGTDEPHSHRVLRSSEVAIGSLVETVYRGDTGMVGMIYDRGWFHRDSLYGPQANPDHWPYKVPAILVGLVSGLGVHPSHRPTFYRRRRESTGLIYTEDLTVPVWTAEYSSFEVQGSFWKGIPVWREIE